MTTNLNLETKYMILEGVSVREIEGEILLMNSASGELYTLNPLGHVIWEQIVNKDTLGRIIEIVSDKYDVLPEQVFEDVVNFLRELETNGFILKGNSQ